MKAQILDINGKKTKDIDLPKCFSQEIREDLISKVLEAKKSKQPHSPSPVAGKQHAAKGKLVHRRHVWRSGYGRGMSRVPRKMMSRRGTQFNWEAAEVPFAKGGMRTHPPKILSMINTQKINKKELKIALCSALSATTDKDKIVERYGRLKGKKVDNLPLIVEGKLMALKAKELISSLKKILGEQLFELALKTKSTRSGKGSMRGRKYKSNAGLLLVTGQKEKLKTGAFEITHTGALGVTELAKGGPGRLTVYTEDAIKELGEKIK